MKKTALSRTISWEEVQRLAAAVAQDIRASGFHPDCLIGITVGGLIPLALLSRELGVRDTRTISATSYSENEQGSVTVSNIPADDLSGSKVLLIDEIADTGETLAQVSRVLRERCGALDIKIATLVVRTDKCKTRPDYSALDCDRWVVFPWEATSG